MKQTTFVRTILEAPDADGPRFVLADWLEERGDPRAAQLRGNGRWVLVSKWHTPGKGKRFKGPAGQQPLHLLVWEDVAGEGEAAVIGAVTPQIKCQRLPGEEEAGQQALAIEQKLRERMSVLEAEFATVNGREPTLFERLELRDDDEVCLGILSLEVTDSPDHAHYDMASIRLGGRWLCWGCATAFSKARTTGAVKKMSTGKIGRLVEAIVPLQIPNETERMT